MTMTIDPNTPAEITGGLPPGQVIEASFHGPGGRIPLRVELFQLPNGAIGVGAYFIRDGERARGTVLRWDRGPDAEPSVVSWQAPHCADDECGAPCGH